MGVLVFTTDLEQAVIHVVATVDLHPQTRQQFLAEFQTLKPAVWAEDGCLEYGEYIDVASGLGPQIPLRPDVVTIIEKWASMNAFAGHAIAPHMQAFRQRVAHLVLKTSLQVLASPSSGG
jgi:quinol monooxygenase YgiN